MPRLTPRRFVVRKRCRIGNVLYHPGDTIDEVSNRPFGRLLQTGVLRLEGEAEASAPAPAPEPEPEEQIDRGLEEMSHKELLATADTLGVEVKRNWSKAKIREAIEEA